VAVEGFVRLPAGFLPGIAPHQGPVLGGKGPLQPRRAPQSDHGRLDGNGPRAAERVHQGALRPPVGQEDQRGGQGLAQGSRGVHGVVAAPVQPRAAGVQHQGTAIAHQEGPDRKGGTRLLQPPRLVALLQTLDDRLLDRALNRRQAGQERRVDMGVHGEARIPGEDLGPGQGLGSLEELFKSSGREFAQPQPDPVGRAQPHVGAAQLRGSSLEVDLPVLGSGVRDSQVGQFSGDDGLQAQGTGGDKMQAQR